MTTDNFWESKSLHEMTETEWESLCDGCGYCCLHKLQDEDTDKIYITRIACELLDIETCKCSDYENRLIKVPMCQKITDVNVVDLPWLPDTCAYRCVAEGRVLPEWHPLLSHSENSVFEVGASIKDFAIQESYVHPDQWQDCIIDEV